MTRTLYTLAYPLLAAKDRKMIDRFRASHDLPYRDMVEPHFTIIFGCTGVCESDYLAHVEAVTGNVSSIEFDCKYAMLGADDESEVGYVFLVPDKGFSAISLLHDRLYTGPLRDHLKLELEYIPHITIGTLDDRKAAKSLCDELNGARVAVAGSLNQLTVAALENSSIFPVKTFELTA